jgi:single-strand DNA-binding protein
MASMNRVTLIGNLGRDPERKQTAKSWVAKLSVATSSKQGEKAETQWHTVKLWGSIAEKAPDLFKKGDQVYLEGSLKYSQHEGKWYTEIHTFHVAKMLRSDQAAAPRAPAPAQAQPPAQESAEDILKSVGFGGDFDASTIPF